MAKAKVWDDRYGTIKIKCPAGHYHWINTKVPNHRNAQWDFNGNLDRPTFVPSINETTGWFVDPNVQGDDAWLLRNSWRCHFIVTEGMIQFCGDCSHGLAGKLMELPDIDDGSEPFD